jgi:hypothetical protein
MTKDFRNLQFRLVKGNQSLRRIRFQIRRARVAFAKVSRFGKEQQQSRLERQKWK